MSQNKKLEEIKKIFLLNEEEFIEKIKETEFNLDLQNINLWDLWQQASLFGISPLSNKGCIIRETYLLNIDINNFEGIIKEFTFTILSRDLEFIKKEKKDIGIFAASIIFLAMNVGTKRSWIDNTFLINLNKYGCGKKINKWTDLTNNYPFLEKEFTIFDAINFKLETKENFFYLKNIINDKIIKREIINFEP